MLADPIGLPLEPALRNYARTWSEGGFAGAFRNSLVVTVLAVLLGAGELTIFGRVLRELRLARDTFRSF